MEAHGEKGATCSSVRREQLRPMSVLPPLPARGEFKRQMEDRCAGVVLLDVGDFIQGGGVRHQAKMEELRVRFRFGKWRDLYMSHGEISGAHRPAACKL